MTNKQLKNEFKQQAYAAVPDKCEELLKTVAAQSDRAASLSDDEDEPHLVLVVPATSQKTAERWLALAACFVVVLVAVIIATNRNDTQLTKRGVVDGDVTTTTTAFETVPSASGSGEISGSVSAAIGSSGSQSGGTATLSAVSGTQTTHVSGLPFQTGGSRISGTLSGGTTVTGAVSSGTTQKGATTSKVSKKTKNPFWGDFSVDTTKKKGSGDATTEKTEAPSAKPTTKRTTAPTTRPTCSHEVIYTPPLPADIRNNSDKVNTCIEYIEVIEPWEIDEPTTPTTKKQSAPSTYGEGAIEFKGYYPNSGGVYYVHYGVAAAAETRYLVVTEVDFADGWQTRFTSQCTENEILYTEVKKFADTGICVYEEKYNERSEIMTITCRDRDGKVLSNGIQKIPLRSPEFSEIWFH